MNLQCIQNKIVGRIYNALQWEYYNSIVTILQSAKSFKIRLLEINFIHQTGVWGFGALP